MKKTLIIVLLSCSMMGWTQPNITLTQKFTAYQKLWPKTTLKLFFNQEKFSPGDTAWFKAYFLTEDLLGVKGNQLIEMNLVDSKGEAKLHILFAVMNGVGYNQFVIPETLPAGIYLITAHSSWMKNFGSDFIYKKRIEIVQNNILAEVDPTLQVGVEGGHLISNIENRVSLYTNQIGSTLQIINEAGVVLGRATANNQGVCSISFTPLPNTAYFVRSAGETTPIPLPATETNGYSLRIIPAIANESKIKINSTAAPEEVTLMITTRGSVFHSAIVPATNEFSLPLPNLPEGVAHIALLNAAGDLLASRDFYTSGVGVQPNIRLDKNQFQPREKVRVEVSLTDNGQPVQGEFAISVLNAGLFSKQQSTLADQLFFPGITEQFTLDRSDSTWLTTLDNLLILFPEKLPWREIKETSRKPRHPFTTVIEKKGRAYFPGTLTPVPDNTQIMFYLQKNLILHQTFASDSGRVGLTLPDIYSPDEFFYMAQVRPGKEIENLKIVWEEEPIVLPKAPMAHETEEADPYAAFVTRSRLINKSFSVFSSDVINVTPEIEESNFEEEIMGANITVQVQDYSLFPTMAELVKEVIPSMYHRKTKKKEIVRVGLLPPMIETNDPVYIIDNIATSNTDFFLSLKPVDLLTIKILSDPRKLAPLGLMGQNGLVIVHTKSGNVREPLDDQAKRITGLSRPLIFKAADSSPIDSHRPDFRSTVYWNPIVKTNANGKAIVEFYTSDDIATLHIQVEGLATGGKPFSAGQEIHVSVPEKQ